MHIVPSELCGGEKLREPVKHGVPEQPMTWLDPPYSKESEVSDG